MSEIHETHSARVGHEQRDVTFRPLVLAGIGMIVVIVATFVGVGGLLDYYIIRGARTGPAPNPLASSVAGRLPPEPRLQTHPRRDLRQQREGEAAVLNTYGWIDEQQQVVRIPIDRAMALLAERAAAPVAPQAGEKP